MLSHVLSARTNLEGRHWCIMAGTIGTNTARPNYLPTSIKLSKPLNGSGFAPTTTTNPHVDLIWLIHFIKQSYSRLQSLPSASGLATRFLENAIDYTRLLPRRFPCVLTELGGWKKIEEKSRTKILIKINSKQKHKTHTHTHWLSSARRFSVRKRKQKNNVRSGIDQEKDH